MALLNASSKPIGERYQVRRWVGAGGMQNVYAAEDLLFQRIVALKTPKDASVARRFERSAIVAARVNHDNVAKTLDYFIFDEEPYLVEEFVDGEDLSRINPKIVPLLPPSACARIFHLLAKGLEASHHAGVVHRDLKPSNIMVVKGSQFDGIKITDFGIAKMAEAEIGQWAEEGKGGSTQSRTVIGAIPYMSPESITSFAASSFASDVWSIAAIIYELMSGKKPFGDALLSIPNILRASPPPKPSTVLAPQFRTLGNQVYELILKCLSADPSNRPTAVELVRQLEPLCYSVDRYEIGTISSVNNSFWGFLRSESGQNAMYHVDSFYGSGAPQVGDKVWFARHPGAGNDRAFPLVKVPK